MDLPIKLTIGAIAAFSLAAGAAFVVVESTATNTFTEGLRVSTYSSIDQLEKDSAVVISGIVSSSAAEVISDDSGRSGPPYTISSVTVTEVLATPGAFPITGEGVKPGDTIRVYQTGLPGALFGGGSVLRADSAYVLFLVPTLMRGADSADYFPTGTFSGIYELAADGTISQTPAEGDTLSATLSGSDLRRALTP